MAGDLATAVAPAIDEFERTRPLRGAMAMITELHRHGGLQPADRQLYMQCLQALHLQDSPARRARLDGWFDEVLDERKKLTATSERAGRDV